MISDIETYFLDGCGRCERFASEDCSSRKWNKGLLVLRSICLEAGLTETLKWGHPCYMHADRNIVVMGAFRDNFRLSFFNPSLMKDPKGVLVKQGENTRYPDMVLFTSLEEIENIAPIIGEYLEEAMEYAEAGIKPVKVVEELVLPEELEQVLQMDDELADAFYALTPGRQKSYVINLNSAKKSETRLNRISKFRDKILAGKGALEG